MRTSLSRSSILVLVAASTFFGCARPTERTADESTGATAHAPTELFLVLANDDQPAELRLKDSVHARYELTTRDEVARLLAARKLPELTLRYAETVPSEQVADLTEFLTRHGVTTIQFVIAPPPPHAPMQSPTPGS